MWAPALDVSMFNELFGCFLPQLGSAVSVWRATYSLENSIVCLGIFSGPRWPITQLNVSQYCTFHLVKKYGKLGLHIPHYLENWLGSISYILVNFHYSMFLYHLSNAFPICFFCHSPHQPCLLSFSMILLFLLPILQSMHKINSIPPSWEIYVYSSSPFLYT